MRTQYGPGQRGSVRHLLSHHPRRNLRARGRESGAALIIALAILMVLLSLAITFILIVRFESNISQQTFDRARAEQLLDGAFAQAQYRLNRDLEVHTDALSLDHGWRSWFSGAAFAGKAWTRAQQGSKTNLSLAGGGLVAINIDLVERALAGPLENGLLYARFTEDHYTEPLFRGPRTEQWLHVPRSQENWVLVFAPADKVRLVNRNGVILDTPDGNFADLNDALQTAGRPERLARWTEDNVRNGSSLPDGSAPFFVVTSFLNRDMPDVNGGLPQEQVNKFADVDSDGDGMKDAIWMPLARDVNHHGDGIDNDLDGQVDPMSPLEDLTLVPAFEAAPFVYHGGGRPPAAVDEDPLALAAIRGVGWNDVPRRWQEANPARGDGFDNNNVNGKDGADEDGLFLTMPLPNLVMQVDLNNDGIFDLRDNYADPATGISGPLYVQLPDTIFVPVMTGLDAAGQETIDRQPVTAVDVLDNDHDLMVNGFRAYAYVGPVKPGYHNINIDRVLQFGYDSLNYYFVDPQGNRRNVTNAAAANFMDVGALRISCTGEPVSTIVGRYAVNITDEAGKANLNAAGGYAVSLEGEPEPQIERAINEGASNFEYDTRFLPLMGERLAARVWNLRTGADEPGYGGVQHPYYLEDALLPGYGKTDDNGNALLLSMSGADKNGDGLVDDGLFAPKLSLNSETWGNINAYLSDLSRFEQDPDQNLPALFTDDVTPLGRLEFMQYRAYYLHLGRFQGIDEPAELRLFNPLPNLLAEDELGEPGRYGDRLLLRKEEVQGISGFGEVRQGFLPPMTTVNSDTRNTFHAFGKGDLQSYLRLDPNYATPQQIAGTLILRGNIGSIVDGVNFAGLAEPVPARLFAEGLRQFDTAFTGDLLGAVRTDTDPGQSFPADPVLQVMRLAADMAAARDHASGRHRLVTENVFNNPQAYRDYWMRLGLNNDIIPPLEGLNERERIPDDEVMPVGDIQEFLNTSLGLTTDDKRVLASDLWWKAGTNEDRLFEYATASLDAIRINEVMVRPVRRVEAETNPLAQQAASGFWAGYTADLTSNLDPAPYPGMLTFALTRNVPLGASSLWSALPRSAYDYAPNSLEQPLLGDHTAYVLDGLPETPTVAAMEQVARDIMEFRFHATDGLPAGRYYLTVNVTDQYGRMTVTEPDMLEFAIKYASPGQGISEDMVALPPAVSGLLFQAVDEPEYIASPAARAEGSAAPVGWVFLPNEPLDMSYPGGLISALYEYFDQLGDLEGEPGGPLYGQWQALQNQVIFPAASEPLKWMDAVFQQDLVNWLLGKGCTVPPAGTVRTLAELAVYLTALPCDWNPDEVEAIYSELLRVDAVVRNFAAYFTDGVSDVGYPAPASGTRTYAVIVPPEQPDDPTTPGYDGPELCIALRMSNEVRLEFTNSVAEWLTWYRDTWDPNSQPFVYPPAAGTYAEYHHFFLSLFLALRPQNAPPWTYAEYQDFMSVLPPVSLPKAWPSGYMYAVPTLAVNFFDFSQEPSHEYLELANVSDEEVDLSGWRLQVGVPDALGIEQDRVMEDPYGSSWRIPDGTRVAAGGHLLLGFDVLDGFMGGTGSSGSPLISSNGMGLVAGNYDPNLNEVTEPPIADNSSLGGSGAPTYGSFYDETGSVFRRNAGQGDYIDNDGDGLSSRPVVFNWSQADADAALIKYNLMEGQPTRAQDPDAWDAARYEYLDTDHVLEEYRTRGSNAAGGIPPWSRIVQLENEFLWRENLREDIQGAPQKYHPFGRATKDYTMEDVDSPTRLAQLVLRGGVLPNYPEHDGVDNDGDGGYVVDKPGDVPYTVIENNVQVEYTEKLFGYVAGTLDKDMIDNNLNWVLDNRGNEIRSTTGAFTRHGDPLLSEGVDEGRLGKAVSYLNPVTNQYDIVSGFTGFLPNAIPVGLPRFYGHGSYEATPLSLFNIVGHPNLSAYRNGWIDHVFFKNNPYLYDPDPLAAIPYYVPGIASPVNLTPEMGFPWRELTGTANFRVEVVNDASIPAVATTDSPDWQAFVERRWNPGDNVIVTLYVGSPENKRVADKVTYRENDVINRTLDDVMPSPYAVVGFVNYQGYPDGSITWEGAAGPNTGSPQVCLDPPGAVTAPGKPSFWLPDHMGLDFYRSLERKHPMYHGDRFGLANRWTVTDGAYDDWAESISVFKQGLGAVYFGDPGDLIPGQVALVNNTNPSPFEAGIEMPRFTDSVDAPGANEQARQLFGHALWGSPLRMNIQARLWENPWDLAQLGFPAPVWPFPANHTRNRRSGHQFPGLDEYRNTGHNLNETNAALTLERRAAADWALRRAVLRKAPFTAPGDLLDLPFLSFERVLEGPGQYFWNPGGAGIYWPQYAVSPINTRYMLREADNPAIASANRAVQTYNSSLTAYGYDRDLTSALASQAVLGGGASVMKSFPGLATTPAVEGALEVAAMNPVVLTVGQARVVPLWPAPPDAVNPATGTVYTEDEHRQMFRWQGGNLPPHNWTPVFLFDAPMPLSGNPVTEMPWMQVNYPRRMASPPFMQTLRRADGEPLSLPVYLFNGFYIGRKLFPNLAGADVDTVNAYLADYLWPRWPVPTVASVIASDFDQRAPANRAVMYISNHDPDAGGKNRAEALFVWDRDSGLENGSYIAYVGTFIPGLAKAVEKAQQLLSDSNETIPLVYPGVTSNETQAVLGLDPENPLVQAVPGTYRFDPRLALQFITDRRFAEQMAPEDATPDDQNPGLLHPRDWAQEAVEDLEPPEPHMQRGAYFRADKEGYILYIGDSGMAWRPMVVRVTDNFLALRVRNMGGPGQVACVSHVVLAPAPRSRGAVNVNTAETHRAVVSGEDIDADNWTIEMFNALMGLPGVVNALNPEANRNMPPYFQQDFGLPRALIPKDTLSVPADLSSPPIDPVRQRWLDIPGADADEAALLTALGAMPPPIVLDPQPLTRATDTGSLGSWDRDLHGRALLRLTSLMAGGRVEHPDGRYYVSPTELLTGIPLGGIAVADERTGPWPLSNWGYPGDNVNNDNEFTPGLTPERHEDRYDEIQHRFSQMSNMITTRSDVFEIIATVQAGSAGDADNDGVLDYRGDEFFPQSERRARIIYDRRARAVRQDESRE